MTDTRDKIIEFYFFVSILLFSFFMPENSYVAENVIVPHIKVSPLYIHFFLTIVIIIILFLLKRRSKILIDDIMMFLFIRIVISIIPVLYIENATESFGLITIPIISAFAYLIGRQLRRGVNSITKSHILFLVILSAQTLYTVTNMVVPNIIYYEQHIKIPIGSSNLIAAYIVPSMLLIFFSRNFNRNLRYFVFIISFLSVVASTSIGALLILIIMSIIYYVYLNNKVGLSIKLSGVFIGLVAIVVMSWIVISFNLSISDLTHQRSDLIMSDVKLWSKHVFLGNGMVYAGRGAGSHNILIDLLAQSGIIGFLLYTIPIFLVLKKLLISKDYLMIGFKMYLISTLLHSLIETSYFNYTGDMLFWFMCGVSISQLNKSFNL